MFERFTDASRRAVVLAQEEARLLNHSYIGTEHLLLGLMNGPETTAGRALAAAGLDLPGLRERVIEIIGEGMTPPSGHIPFTPRAKRVLEMGLREAVRLSSQDIGPEHLLLGILREGEGVAAQILAREGLNLETARATVSEAAGSDPKPSRSGRRPSLPPANCMHPDNELMVARLEIGIRTVRCQLCGRLVATFPDA